MVTGAGWLQDTPQLFFTLATTSNLLSISTLTALNTGLLYPASILACVATLLLPICYASAWIYTSTAHRTLSTKIENSLRASSCKESWLMPSALLSCIATVQRSTVATFCILAARQQQESCPPLSITLAVVHALAASELYLIIQVSVGLRKADGVFCAGDPEACLSPSNLKPKPSKDIADVKCQLKQLQ